MTAETSHHMQEKPQQTEYARSDDWEKLPLGEEEFLVKKERFQPAIFEGKEVVFDINEYHHPETGTQITVFSLGLNQDVTKPAIVRADYGCPCMSLGTGFTVPGHDCSKQREMMFKTIADLGIGAVAIVSEQTAAGNGHGAHVVFDQSTKQYKAAQEGKPIPSMEQFYSEEGYFPFDTRRHDLVAKALADTVGTTRPVIPGMSSKNKIQTLRDAGMHVMEGVRVDFVTDPGVHDAILRRSSHGQRPNLQEGAYLSIDMPSGNPAHISLTPATFEHLHRAQSQRKAPMQRRLAN